MSVAEHSRCGPRRDGFTLLETVVALAIFGFAVLLATAFRDAQVRAARRAELRLDLLRTAEAVMESVRGGAVPLASGPVDLGDELRPPTSGSVVTSVDVAEDPELEGLYEVRVTASAQERGRPVAISLTSAVWRP